MTARPHSLRRPVAGFAVIVLLLAACRDRPEHTPSAFQAPTSQPVTATSGEPQIRVRLASGLAICLIEMEDPFDIVASHSREHLLHVEQPGPVSVAFDRDTILLPGLNRAWKLPAIDITGCGEKPIAVELPDDHRLYPGHIRFVHEGDNLGSIINIVGLETYLVGVVAAELHRGFHSETFRAQAIASRTYAWCQMQRQGPSRAYDVTANESHQVYADLDRAAAVPEAAAAVRDTHGLIRLLDTPDEWRPYNTYFSSTCGGETLTFDPNDRQAASLALPSTCLCTYCQRSPHYRWGPVTLTKSFITEQLRHRYEKFKHIGPIDHIEVAEATEGGRLVQLVICDQAEGRIPLEAENFRLAVDPTGRTLRSTLVRMIDEDASITFADGRGFGHGIGMCQYGADTLARNGKSAEQILQHYYPSSRSASAY